MGYRPTLGGAVGAPFPLQFGDASVSAISMSTTPIEQLANDGSDAVVSHGSGFMWRHGDKAYLITARHVVSGQSPFDGMLLSDKGFIPRRFNFYPAFNVGVDNWARRRVSYEFEEGSDEAWFEDRDFSTLRTDIAALPVPLPPELPVRCLNDSPDIYTKMWSHVGLECAIVGYPTSSFGDLMTPIWRRGSVASEPSLPVDGKPMFLLDATTSPGFSGSPVFRRQAGPMPVQQPDGSLNVNLDNVLAHSFVGVYAGRLQHPHIGGEVPFVFYGNRLPFILPPLST